MTGRIPDPSELADDIIELKSMVAAIGTKIDALPYIRTDVYEARHTALRTEIALEQAALNTRIDVVERKAHSTEERQTWVARTAMAGLLLPVLVGIFFALFAAVGGGT